MAGLWATAGFAPWTAPWVAGAAVAVLGSGALAAGIRSELSVW